MVKKSLSPGEYAVTGELLSRGSWAMILYQLWMSWPLFFPQTTGGTRDQTGNEYQV